MSLEADPRLLNLVATALAVVVLARVASHPWRADLWAFGLYALLACAAAIGLLLAFAPSFEVKVFLVGVAAVAGVYWTAVARPHRPLPARSHLASAGAAAALALLLGLLAVAYRWWFAPLALLLLLAAGLVANGLLPLARSWRGRAEAPEATPAPAEEKPAAGRPLAPPPTSVSPTPPLPAALPPARPVPAGHGAIQCPTCFLRGSLPASRAGRTVACPRCGAQVRVPPARPPAPGLPKGPPARPILPAAPSPTRPVASKPPPPPGGPPAAKPGRARDRPPQPPRPPA